MKAEDLFTLPEHFPFHEYFRPDMTPWAWVQGVQKAMAAYDFSNQPGHTDIPPGVHIEGDVFIHPSVKLPAYAVIEGPAYIGKGTQIRPGAYIRGNVIVGEGCVLGNACEFKNSLLMDQVQVPHFNYVGDSVLGSGAHLGAGVILANLRLDQKEVSVKTPDGRMHSGMRKLGGILGESAEVGCNAVIQPGAVLGKSSVVLSTVAFAGYLPEGQLAKTSSRLSIHARPRLA